MKDRKELVIQRFPKYMRTSYFGRDFENLIDRFHFQNKSTFMRKVKIERHSKYDRTSCIIIEKFEEIITGKYL